MTECVVQSFMVFWLASNEIVVLYEPIPLGYFQPFREVYIHGYFAYKYKNKNRFTIYTHTFFDITGAPLYTLPYFVGYNFRAEWSIKGFFVHVGLVRFFYNTFFTSLLV